MTGGHSFLVQALVYLAAGVLAAPVAKRLGLGSVLGYLIAGALIGPFALSLVGQEADVVRFAEFGVVFLLFLIGLEVRPALLWSLRGAIFGLGGAQVLLTAAAIGAACLALGLPWRSALAVGLVTAMSSTAIVLQMLEEKGFRGGPVGNVAFGVLLLQDLAVIPLFAILPLLAMGGPATTPASQGLLADQPSWVQGLAILGAVAVVIGGGRYLTRPVFRFIAEARLREIFTASALLLVIAVAALMEIVGLSPALGAFLAGVVLADSEFRRELETDIEPFRGLLLGLFFITVGAGLDFKVVAAAPLALFAVVLGLMTLKAAVMYGLARFAKLSRQDAAASAVMLSQVGEFAFVLIGLIAADRVVEPGLAAFFTAAVALSMALTPLAMIAYERVNAAVEGRRERAVPENKPFDTGAPDAIIAGFGRFGQIAGRLLTANGFSTVVLDDSIEQVETLRRFGRRVHYGDATRLDLLRQAGAAKAKVLVVAIDDRDQASQLVESAHAAFPGLKIMARAWDRRHAYDLLRNGADAVERETFESALRLGVRALTNLGFRAHRAYRAGALFRQHDLKAFYELAPVAGEEERYILAVRDSQSTMDRLLKADLDKLRPDYVDEPWDVSSLGGDLVDRVPPAKEGRNMTTDKRPAAFLDRDGVLNVDCGYVHRVEDLEWVPGCGPAVRRLNEAGYLVIIVTNQSGIGRGYYDEAAMEAVHTALRAHLAQAGGRIDAIYFCPHHEDSPIARYRHADHPDRKPNPGMLLRAMADFAIDAQRSFMIGDKDSDMEAARRAGVAGHLFVGGDLDAFVRALLGV